METKIIYQSPKRGIKNAILGIFSYGLVLSAFSFGIFLISIPFTTDPLAAAPNQVLLTSKNTVTIRGPINPESIATAQLELSRLDFQRGRGKYPIYLVLDTPGGDVSAGLSFVQYAKTLRNLKTITLDAASMGAMIVQLLPGERLVTDNSTFMFHRASVRMGGQIENGEMESRLAHIKKMIRKVGVKIAKRMGLDYISYSQKIVNEWWMYGDEAIEQKAADREVSLICARELTEKYTTTKIRVLIFETVAKFSKCPLFRGTIGGR